MNTLIFSMGVLCLLGMNGVEGNCDVAKCMAMVDPNTPPPCNEMDNILECFNGCSDMEAPMLGPMKQMRDSMCSKRSLIVKKSQNGVKGNCDVAKCLAMVDPNAPPRCNEMDNILECFDGCSDMEAPMLGSMKQMRDSMCSKRSLIVKKFQNLVRKDEFCPILIATVSEEIDTADCMTMKIMLDMLKEEGCTTDDIQAYNMECSCSTATFMECGEAIFGGDSDEELTTEETCTLYHSYNECMGDCTPDKMNDNSLSEGLAEATAELAKMCIISKRVEGNCNVAKCMAMVDPNAPPSSCNEMDKILECFDGCGDMEAPMLGSMKQMRDSMCSKRSLIVKKFQNVWQKMKNRQ